MEGVDEGIAAVHNGIVITRSHHMGVVVLVGEMMTMITATMIGAGGLEAEALAKEDVVEVPGKGEIGAQLGKAVLREGQRLSNGTGKGNRRKSLTRMVMVTLMITRMTWH